MKDKYVLTVSISTPTKLGLSAMAQMYETTLSGIVRRIVMERLQLEGIWSDRNVIEEQLNG